MICLISSIICISCAKTKDITDNSILRGNYKNGLVLKVKSDILLDEYNYLWGLPHDIENARQYGISDDYKGFVKEGTKLRILRIELYHHIQNGNDIYPIALVLDGEWEGEEVNLHYTSKSSNCPENDSYYIDILDVDLEMFEIVN
jgi:hypothetical protein